MPPEEIQIVCTVGPTSLNPRVLRCLEARNVSLLRLNMSHLDIDRLAVQLELLRQFAVPIAIDTEGSQIRTGTLHKGALTCQLNDVVRIHDTVITCDRRNLYLTPVAVAHFFHPGDLIAIDFNSVQLRVEDCSRLTSHGYIEARVIIAGQIGSRKGVHCRQVGLRLPTFSKKDLQAFELAKSVGIRHFTLSFINCAADVRKFRQLVPDAIAYAKIETAAGVKNLDEILPHADGILIDRGDLSRDIPIEKIPLTQKHLIAAANRAGKPALVASNLLETMATDLKPTRAEVNDIVNTVLDGAGGFVLTTEIAVGRYPVETVNMLKSLINQGQLALRHGLPKPDAASRSVDLSFLEDHRYSLCPELCSSLPQPHGGELVDLQCEQVTENLGLPMLRVGDETLLDLEQLAIGTFSPLTGFMGDSDLRAVLNEMRLANGTPWPLPIVLAIDSDQRQQLARTGRALLAARDGTGYGSIVAEEIYPFDKEDFARKVYGTTDPAHPGVQWLKQAGEYLVGGSIELYRRTSSATSRLHLTPRQTRELFSALGWVRVIGFHTRNVANRFQEYLLHTALQNCGSDGVLIHPVIGKKKPGDFVAEVIVDSYEQLIEKFLPLNRVVLGVFSTFSRYAGPREAVFNALCRKNYGCSHFIVGWNHAGYGNLYPPYASQEIFTQFDQLGIEPVFFDQVGYSQQLNSYLERTAAGAEQLKQISAAEVKALLRQQTLPPPWFMRPEVSQRIIDKFGRNERIFV